MSAGRFSRMGSVSVADLIAGLGRLRGGGGWPGCLS
jgi:hypothetical protein